MSWLNLKSLLPVKDLRKLLFAKLEPWDKLMVKLAHCPTTLPAPNQDTEVVSRVFATLEFQHWCVAHGYIALLEYIKPHVVRCVPVDSKDVNLSCTAAESGHVHVLHWLGVNGCFMGRVLYSCAARGGHVHVLQWLKDHGFHCPQRTDVGMLETFSCRMAAEKGHLPALQWLVQNGFSCNWETSSVAAIAGHLDVLEWLVDNRCPVITSIAPDTAEAGQLHVLQWLHSRDNRNLWTENYCSICIPALSARWFHILQWATSEGCPCKHRVSRDRQLCIVAARDHGLHVLRWLVANGYPIDIDECLAPNPLEPQLGSDSDVIAYLKSMRAH